LCLGGGAPAWAAAAEATEPWEGAIHRSISAQEYQVSAQAGAPNWRQHIQHTISAQEYEVSAQPEASCAPAGSPGATVHQAPNRAHNLRTCFTSDGVRVTPRSGKAQWRWGLALRGYGDAGRLRSPAAAHPQARGNRVEYDRGVLTEWYVNDPRGLEQGFTLHRPVTQSAETILRIGVTGTLAARAAIDAIEFVSGGAPMLSYGQLVATDASGATLASSMRLVDEAIEIVVTTAGARYPVTVDPLIAATGWNVQSNQADAWLGYSVATAGDVNGDGFSDVIVGAPLFDGGESDEGRAWVFHGGPGGLPTTHAWSVEGNANFATLGHSVATAGDVNGDGFSDVIVGAPSANGGNGRALVYHGSASGLAPTPAWDRTTTVAFAGFGTAVAPAGDVNDDGFSDVVVGAPSYGAGGQFNEGAAFVFHGSGSGLSATAAWSVEGGQNGAELGISVATSGDVNGDGYSDVIVGAWRHDDAPNDNKGIVYGYHGGASGLGGTMWAVQPTVGGTDFGRSVATAGDFNGDGYSDVVIGAPLTDALGMTDSGVVYFYQGSATGLSTITMASNDSSSLARLGTSVASAGDVNGDGYGDVVVGAPEALVNGQAVAGRAAIYYGNPGFDLSFDDFVVDVPAMPAGNTRFGFSVSAAGDVNGDGFADVVIGARDFESETGQSNEGRAHLFLGGPNPPGAVQAWRATATFEPAARLGHSVGPAGDVNGDGFADVIVGMPNYDGVDTDAGRVLAYLGDATGLADAPAWSAEPDRAGALFGFSAAGAGDVNGDGYGDVIVGAPADSNDLGGQGRVYVYHGAAGGLDTIAARILETSVAGAIFGNSVATAGDVNGDGYADVIVGAPGAGRAHVYLGSPSGLQATPHWTVQPSPPSSTCGASVAAAGDVNGDGFSDVIFGCPTYTNGQLREGRALVYHGSSAGLAPIAAWTAESGEVDGFLGFAVATAGDVNGDGYTDVIVGAAGYDVGPDDDVDEGAAFVYHGGPSGLAIMPDWVEGPGVADAAAGTSVATAGDVDGDGYADVLVGAPRLLAASPARSGHIAVFRGGPAGLSTGAYWSFQGSQAAGGQGIGFSVATAGDVNGDGYDDVLAGAPDALFGGEALLWYGNGPVKEPSLVVGRGGVALNPRQLHSLGVAGIGPLGFPALPLAPLGGTGVLPDGVLLQAEGRTPFGRGDVALEWELRLAGSPFVGGDAVMTEDWNDAGTGGVALIARPPGLDAGTLHGWRVRIRYRPSTTPFQPHGPWLTSAVNALQGDDFRTEVDTDADGVIDRLDNCRIVANAGQGDADGDCVGNRCDGDLNNTGGTVNFADLSIFRALFGTVAPIADFNASGGVVNFADLGLFRALFGVAVGPSGLLPLSSMPQPGQCGP
jgi:hypothetical protein